MTRPREQFPHEDRRPARPGPAFARRGPESGPRGRPPLRIFPTTLWEYPSQHYDSPRLGEVGGTPRDMQGDKAYAGATPSWVVWQLLSRYTREGDAIVDPMCGSGTTMDVCRDLNRKGIGFDLSRDALQSRPDLKRADARHLPIPDESADFAFIDPPYSTHIEYSGEPGCIGKLDALAEDGGRAYYDAMEQVIRELKRVLRPRRYMALYVSDSYRKSKGKPGGRFAPIGFRLFETLARHFQPVDIICVVRHNQKLARGNFRKAAEEGNFFLRGFNYLFIMRKA